MNNLKDLTNMFLVFAEDEAKQRHVMTMKDWIDATDDLLKFRRKEILNNSGSISHKEAVEKAEKEYEKFRVIQDQKYISSMDEFYNKYLNESNDNEYGSVLNGHVSKKKKRQEMKNSENKKETQNQMNINWYIPPSGKSY